MVAAPRVGRRPIASRSWDFHTLGKSVRRGLRKPGRKSRAFKWRKRFYPVRSRGGLTLVMAGDREGGAPGGGEVEAAEAEDGGLGVIVAPLPPSAALA